MKLYVGNLPPTFKERELEELFLAYGTVKSAKVIMDRETGKSKGFGFVEMGSREEGMEAMKGLDKKVVGTSPIVVNEARPQERREGGGNSPFKKRYNGGGGGY